MLPEGFETRMQKLLGAEYDEFLSAFDRPLCTGLRRNPLKPGFTGDLLRFALSPVPWCPTGFYYDASTRPGLSPLHAAGLYYLQEPSAMAPAELLDPQPGERVLDLCAAPGGKSTQLAGKMQGCGILVCNEINAKRAKILSGNIERLGIANALVLNEHPKRLAERFAGWFDKILVDAPCSGEGMFRKEAAAVTDWTGEIRMQRVSEGITEHEECPLRIGLRFDPLIVCPAHIAEVSKRAHFRRGRRVFRPVGRRIEHPVQIARVRLRGNCDIRRSRFFSKRLQDLAAGKIGAVAVPVAVRPVIRARSAPRERFTQVAERNALLRQRLFQPVQIGGGPGFPVLSGHVFGVDRVFVRRADE